MKFWIPPAALALALTPLAFVHPVKVQGDSMEPALRPGQLCWALRAWCAGGPQRGQVWLVDAPGGPALKRVAGLPGERLAQREGELWADGRPLEETYPHNADRGDLGPWPCGEGWFLAGDNRPRSRDSRAWGSLPASAFRGRILGHDAPQPPEEPQTGPQVLRKRER